VTDSFLAKEQEVLVESQKLLTDTPERVTPEVYAKLTADYSRLLKNFSRIIRISDRNELRLQSVSDELEIEKKKLEGVAGQLAKYLPRQIYDSIFKGDQSLEIKTQRKLLTVFFSDIQGFTHISSVIQPEVLTHYINAYFSEMSDIAAKYGGTVDKYIGDAMMVFFGDPESRGPQEDALACVRMAYEMQERLAELHIEWQREGLQHPFITRIGINTGYCNVGNFGSHSRMAYTILGGEVNLAARIESKCEPGGVLISHETYAQVKDFVEVSERDLLELKGIPMPIKTYALVKVSDTNRSHTSELRLDLKGLDKIVIKPGNLSMPDRLSLVARLRDMANTLEGIDPHD
jgi:class 3 adenylate cyclase